MANIATAFANTLMGMGTVFVMLIFISLLKIRREDQKYREKTRTCKDRRISRSCRGTTDTGS